MDRYLTTARFFLAEKLGNLVNKRRVAHKEAAQSGVALRGAVMLRRLIHFIEPAPRRLSDEETARDEAAVKVLFNNNLAVTITTIRVGTAIVLVSNYDTQDGEPLTYTFTVRRTNRALKKVSVVEFLLACLAGKIDRNASRLLDQIDGIDVFHEAVTTLIDSGYSIDSDRACAVSGSSYRA
jgi:hypothetical protein